MNILVLNSGSSSLKFKLFIMPEENVLLHGQLERMGTLTPIFSMCVGDNLAEVPEEIATLEQVLEVIDSTLKKQNWPLQAIVHRVVHGGEKYHSAVIVDKTVMEDAKALCDLAPLHNPANVAGIEATQKRWPDVVNIAVFDTAFHHTIPPKAYLYGLPYELYEKYRIRKYGFHGISHQYVAHKAMEILRENIRDFKILSCHLGSGASICAISEGKSVEISMGFTPLEGLMMGTRAGSFDPEIVIYLLRKGYKIEEIEEMMQKKSGLAGISKKGFDVRELREEELMGHKQSELAFAMFVYRVQRFIGSYTAALGGLDVLIFTGGVGEKAYFLRRRICSNFGYLGLEIDARKNRANDNIISTSDSDVTVMTVPTNEELAMARDAAMLLRREKWRANTK